MMEIHYINNDVEKHLSCVQVYTLLLEIKGKKYIDLQNNVLSLLSAQVLWSIFTYK